MAQDTTKYGQDLYGEYALDKLLTELCKIDGFHWIRVLYGYPDRVTDGLLEVWRRSRRWSNTSTCPCSTPAAGCSKR